MFDVIKHFYGITSNPTEVKVLSILTEVENNKVHSLDIISALLELKSAIIANRPQEIAAAEIELTIEYDIYFELQSKLN